MNKKLRYMMLCLSLFAFGCNDWLDVQPKSQVKEEDLFSSESGFRDALTGIYALMGRVETYGGNSTMGFMDMLAQTYSKVDYDYEDALKYNYKEEHVKGIVDTMWSSNYNAIANCNYLLQNIEKKGSVMSERLRNVVEGEALALRAFLHFDLLRGYAPSYKMGKDEPAIPYVREVTNSPVVQSTVAEVLEYILTDLKTAQALLKPVDPIGPSFAEYNDKLEYGMDEYITDDGFWLYRKSRLNYYGVTALMARVYLCQENLTDALACAQEVIDSKRFEFMNDSINNVYAYRNLSYIEKMARHEYVSSLYVYDLKEGRSDLFFKNLASCECVIAKGFNLFRNGSGSGYSQQKLVRNACRFCNGICKQIHERDPDSFIKTLGNVPDCCRSIGGYPLSGNLAGQSGICYRSATGRGEFTRRDNQRISKRVYCRRAIVLLL